MSLTRRAFFGLGGEAEPEAERRLPRFDIVACTHRTDFCQACVERCPAEGALTMGRFAPVVSEWNCTGCGDCARVCPSPFGAVVMQAGGA
ncbi:MAG: hypothetical protein FJ102_02015 [Deltaproteobacteria bacterium]|nr:hypothetical protein [Deltaproteobacteria bacterium]